MTNHTVTLTLTAAVAAALVAACGGDDIAQIEMCADRPLRSPGEPVPTVPDRTFDVSEKVLTLQSEFDGDPRWVSNHYDRTLDRIVVHSFEADDGFQDELADVAGEPVSTLPVRYSLDELNQAWQAAVDDAATDAGDDFTKLESVGIDFGQIAVRFPTEDSALEVTSNWHELGFPIDIYCFDPFSPTVPAG